MQSYKKRVVSRRKPLQKVCVCKELQNITTEDLQQREPYLVELRPKLLSTQSYNWGPAATNALPASLVVYFAKFLMKRAAKSLAFSSHTEASA